MKKHIWIAGQEFELEFVIGGGTTRVRLDSDDTWYGHHDTQYTWVENDIYPGTPPWPESVLSELETYLVHHCEKRRAFCRPACDSKWSNPPLSEKEWAAGAPPKGPRIEWSPELLQFELERALGKGYLVLPSSTLTQLEVFTHAFDSTATVDIPPTGHVILRFSGTCKARGKGTAREF
ncbi:MAG: hypothetical protein ACO3N7_11640 [Kiritimatiellia bacterium]